MPRAESTHLAVVDADNGADHLGDDDHVAEVGLHDRGLLVGGRLLLGLAELLDEAHRLALETALEPPASAGVDDLKERGSIVRGLFVYSRGIDREHTSTN